MERNELKEKLKEFIKELEKDDVDVEEINNKLKTQSYEKDYKSHNDSHLCTCNNIVCGKLLKRQQYS